MSNNWKDIKDQIISAEELLQKGSWKAMEKKLDHNSSNRIYGFLAVLLLFEVLTSWSIQPSIQETKVLSTSKSAEKLLINETQNITNYNKENSSADYKESLAKQHNKHDGNELSISKNSAASQVFLREGEITSNQVFTKQPEGDDYATDSEISKESSLNIAAKSLSKLKIDTENLIAFLNRERTDYILPNSPIEKKREAYSPGFELNPYIGFTYNIPNYNYQNEELKTNRRYNEVTSSSIESSTGFDAGIEVNYILSKYIKVGVGIGYRKLITQNQYDYEINEIPVIDSESGNILAYIPLPNGNEREIKNSSFNSYEYFNLPLSLYYGLPLRGNWSLTSELTHQFSFLVNQNSAQIDSKTLEVKNAGNDVFNKFLISAQLKLGVQYKINSSLSLALEPSFRTYYTDVYKDSNVSWKPQDIALNLSAVIQFNNIKK